MSERLTRRTFTKAAAATLAMAATGSSRALGANDRIRLGFIGVANRGGQLLTAFLEHADAEIVALCDVHKPTLQQARQRLGGKPDTEVEIGHRSTTMSLLANISLLTRSRLEWDAETEKIVSPQEANQLLHYEYRKPWKLG